MAESDTLTEQVMVRLTPAMRSLLAAHAEENDRSEAAVIRLALKDYLGVKP